MDKPISFPETNAITPTELADAVRRLEDANDVLPTKQYELDGIKRRREHAKSMHPIKKLAIIALAAGGITYGLDVGVNQMETQSARIGQQYSLELKNGHAAESANPNDLVAPVPATQP